jgi:hypothetical protein
MGLLSWIGRTVVPIVLEHSAPIVRDITLLLVVSFVVRR